METNYAKQGEKWQNCEKYENKKLEYRISTSSVKNKVTHVQISKN